MTQPTSESVFNLHRPRFEDSKNVLGFSTRRDVFRLTFVHRSLYFYQLALLILIPFFLATLVANTLSHAYYFGWDSLWRYQYFALAAKISFQFLTGAALPVILCGPLFQCMDFVHFPTTLTSGHKGLSFGPLGCGIDWQDVMLIRIRKYVFQGRITGEFFELYVKDFAKDNSKSGFLAKLMSLMPNSPLRGMQRWSDFYDMETKSLAQPAFDAKCLRIPLALFQSDAEVMQFGKMLEQKLPTEVLQLSPEYFATPSSSRPHNGEFTSLWLKGLRNSDHASKLRILNEGHKLKEGRYTVESVIACGGFSVVYSAYTSDSERVAIKEIFISSGGSRVGTEAIADQILSEIRILTKLEHPNIVSLRDSFVEHSSFYIVMEALNHQDLREMVLRQGARSEVEVIAIALQCCAALNYLHKLSPPVIHKDFAPDNLVWDGYLLKVVDFNIADDVGSALHDSGNSTIWGKHAYLAPEQWCGNFGMQGDLYQLGCTLFFLSTGQDPQPLSCTSPVNLQPSLSPGFCNVVVKLTAQSLENRYDSVADAWADLKAIAVGDANA